MENRNLILFGTLVATLMVGTGYLGYHLHQTRKEQAALCSQVGLLKEETEKHALPEQKCALKKFESWTEVQAHLRNTVIQVIVQVAQFNWLEPYTTPTQGQGAGSGFFINDQGYFITNFHVVSQATAVAVMVPEFGKELLDAEIIGVAPDRDLALLKLKPNAIERFNEKLGKIPYVELGDSNTVRRADEIMTLGYPLAQHGLKSTTGVISGRENIIGRNLIQMDAPINPGNSGGPAIDVHGKVVGINMGTILASQNVNYIIPINELKLVLDNLYHAENKLLRKPYIGIFHNMASAALTAFLGNPQPGGYYVTDIYPKSVADKAGIKEGDMLYEIDGHRIDIYGQINLPWSEDKVSFADYLSFIAPGETITLNYYRHGKKMSASFPFNALQLPAVRTRYPDYETIDYEVFAGMVVMELSHNHLPLLLGDAHDLIIYEDPRNQLEPALVVTHVIPDSVAQRSRLVAPGNRLAEVNGVAVKTLAELRKAIEKSVTNNFLRVKLSSHVFAVFPLDQILEDELRLSPLYHYPVSQTLQKIMRMKAYNASQAETRPSGETAVSGTEQNANQ